MSTKSFLTLIAKYYPCDEARAWLRSLPDDTSHEEIWATCPQGDWLLWLAGKANIDRKVLVMAACACTRLALRFVKEGELRPVKCIETTEAWCRGEATIEQVKEARREAAYAYAAAAAAYAADTAAAYAADTGGRAAARASTRLECAVKVREIITWKMVSAAIR